MTRAALEKVRSHPLDHCRTYGCESCMLLFFSCAVTGWGWEVLFCLAQTGEIVNRGFLTGPWLPIYGVGGVMILVLLRPLRERPGALFLGAVALCGVLEYATSWALEAALHLRYWDYSGYPLNIQGRVCPAGLLAFGVAALGLTYVGAPQLDELCRRLRPEHRRALLIGLTALFCLDLLCALHHPNTGAGIAIPEI